MRSPPMHDDLDSIIIRRFLRAALILIVNDYIIRWAKFLQQRKIGGHSDDLHRVQCAIRWVTYAGQENCLVRCGNIISFVCFLDKDQEEYKIKRGSSNIGPKKKTFDRNWYMTPNCYKNKSGRWVRILMVPEKVLFGLTPIWPYTSWDFNKWFLNKKYL